MPSPATSASVGPRFSYVAVATYRTGEGLRFTFSRFSAEMARTLTPRLHTRQRLAYSSLRCSGDGSNMLVSTNITGYEIAEILAEGRRLIINHLMQALTETTEKPALVRYNYTPDSSDNNPF